MAGSQCPIKVLWSFKTKGRPDGTIIKYKARLCAHGGMQKYGIYYWDTFSPVVNWITVRLLTTISLIENLQYLKYRFHFSISQANVEAGIFMELPVGFKSSIDGDYVLKIVKKIVLLKECSKRMV